MAVTYKFPQPSMSEHADKVLAAIKSRLPAVDVTWNVHLNEVTFQILGEEETFHIRDERSHWGIRSEPNGKRRLHYEEKIKGDWRSKTTSLPQRSDGSFDYDRVAAALVHNAQLDAEASKQREMRKSNKAGVEAFKQAFGLLNTGEITALPSKDEDGPIRIVVHFGRTLSYADAEKLINTLRTFGIAPRMEVEDE